MILRKDLGLPFNNEPSSSVRDEKSSQKLCRTDSDKVKLSIDKTDDIVLRREHHKDIIHIRQHIIDEEPDSMDSIISDPSSFPITIVPSPTSPGSGLLIRNSTTQSSFSRLSKISTNSK